jgi:hypothetical protein
MTSMPDDGGSLSLPEASIGRLARRLCIVARNHPLLFGYLSTLFRDRPAGSERIDIVIDRRHVEAQKTPEVERRAPSVIDDELRRRGFAFVAQPGEAFSPRDAARIEHTVELLAGMEERSWPFRRRRRRPLWRRWQQLWTQRPWKPLAVLGGVALVSTLLATEFRLNDFREVDFSDGRARSAAKTPSVKAPTPRAEAPVVTRAAVEPAAPAPRPAAPAPLPAAPATARPAPAPASSEPTTFFAPLSPAADPAKPAAKTTHGGAATVHPASARDKVPAKPAPRVEAPPKPAPAPAPAEVRTAARDTAAPTPPAAPDLRLELSKRPTSATGGGFVYTVRVTDLSGQPLPDAQVWLEAGRRPSGALFETRLLPAEAAGTFRSGVVHPGTLPPDMMVRAQVGTRRVEAVVER